MIALVVLRGAITVLRRRALEPAIVLDVARALGAGAITILVFHVIPPAPPWVGMPLCVGTFGAASVAVGLLRREELAVLRSLARRPRILTPQATGAARWPRDASRRSAGRGTDAVAGSARRSQHSR